MSNPNIYQPNVSHQQQHEQPGYPQSGQQPNDETIDFRNYRFSPEELRVIAECESESFYYRSLPFSLGLGTATFLGVKNGVLKASKNLGPWPKVIGMGFVGYFIGRLSYTTKCQEKMMALPNSKFAEILRQKNRKCNAWERSEAGAAMMTAPFQSATSNYSDEFGQPNALNLDTSRPNYSGLDDTYQPTMEGINDLNEDLAIPTRKNTVTYDELRQKNRDEYARSHHNQPSSSAYYSQRNQQAPPPQPPAGPFIPPAGSFNPTSSSDHERRRPNLRRSEDESATGPKNRYGDVLSD